MENMNRDISSLKDGGGYCVLFLKRQHHHLSLWPLAAHWLPKA